MTTQMARGGMAGTSPGHNKRDDEYSNANPTPGRYKKNMASGGLTYMGGSSGFDESAPYQPYAGTAIQGALQPQMNVPDPLTPPPDWASQLQTLSAPAPQPAPVGPPMQMGAGFPGGPPIPSIPSVAMNTAAPAQPAVQQMPQDVDQGSGGYNPPRPAPMGGEMQAYRPPGNAYGKGGQQRPMQPPGNAYGKGGQQRQPYQPPNNLGAPQDPSMNPAFGGSRMMAQPMQQRLGGYGGQPSYGGGKGGQQASPYGSGGRYGGQPSFGGYGGQAQPMQQPQFSGTSGYRSSFNQPQPTQRDNFMSMQDFQRPQQPAYGAGGKGGQSSGYSRPQSRSGGYGKGG